MTTIAVVKKNGEVAIAADSQATAGGAVASRSTKIIHSGESYFATTGDSAFADFLDHLLYKLDNPPTLNTKYEVIDFTIILHKLMKEHYFLVPGKDEVHGGFELSGSSFLLANPSGIYSVYSNRTVEEHETFFAMGSGSEFARGAMEILYHLFDSPQEIANKAVEAASKHCIYTSFPVDSFVVQLKEGE